MHIWGALAAAESVPKANWCLCASPHASLTQTSPLYNSQQHKLTCRADQISALGLA